LSSAGALAVVVVTHNSAAHLPRLFQALSPQLHPHDELVVVDNASTDDTEEVTRKLGAPARLVQTNANLGFGAGCHAGAKVTSAPLLLFLNPDSEPQPGCLDRLRSVAEERPDWAAWQAIVLLPDGRINTSGGVVHYLGIGWAGECGKPVSKLQPRPYETAFASGAAMLIRRSAWVSLSGFDAGYFMYVEDLDLGLRLWLAGHRVGVVPDAFVKHTYEFDKGESKWFWLERNRWQTVLSVYPTGLLISVLPALAAAELVIAAAAARDGWLGAKLRAQIAVIRAIRPTARRRRMVQATRKLDSAGFAEHLTASLDSPYLPTAQHRWLDAAQAAYWAVVQRALGVFTRR
jgi:N-acetylglucosaminyl-diphospho-decaprenol L-rhamnosyltransferase